MDELYHKIAVTVDAGTGCLFQPLSDDFTYVLTAKHNIICEEGSVLPKDEIEVFAKPDNDGRVIQLSVLEVYIDDVEDAAILLVEKVAWPVHLLTMEPKRNQQVSLFGYPDRLEGDHWIGKYDIIQDGERPEIKIISPKERMIGSIPEGTAVVGISGCGVFVECEGKPIFLLGIEYELADNINLTGRLKFLCIKVFSGIAKANELPSLYPAHLIDFSNYSVLWDDRHMDPTVTGVFREESEIIERKGVTPLLILENFKNALILCLNEEWQHRKEMWEGIYEILTYKNFITSPDAASARELIEKLCHNRKLIYTGDKHWAGFFKEVLEQDLKDLKPGAYIIFNSEDKRGRFKFSGKSLLTRIGRPDRTKFKIGEGIKPQSDFVFIHLEYFRRFLEERCDILFDTDLEPTEIKQEIIQILKQSFEDEIIEIEE